MRSIAAAAVSVLVVLVAAPTATPGTSAKLDRRPSLEAAVIRALNDVRSTQGLQPLHSSPSLRTAARGHSRAMLDYGFFGHESADGSAFSDRIRRYYTNHGWRKWSVGEALLASQGLSIDATAIVKAWLESPSHREIILSPTFRDAGIGALYAPSAPKAFGGADAVVVTADFGLREGRVSPS
jgi:uncharacterized protein YkwD